MEHLLQSIVSGNNGPNGANVQNLVAQELRVEEEEKKEDLMGVNDVMEIVFKPKIAILIPVPLIVYGILGLVGQDVLKHVDKALEVRIEQ